MGRRMLRRKVGLDSAIGNRRSANLPGDVRASLREIVSRFFVGAKTGGSMTFCSCPDLSTPSVLLR